MLLDKSLTSDQKGKLSAKLWPEMNVKSRYVSMSRLMNGKMKTFKISWVKIMCDFLGKTPNELFGYPWRKKVIIRKKIK